MEDKNMQKKTMEEENMQKLNDDDLETVSGGAACNHNWVFYRSYGPCGEEIYTICGDKRETWNGRPRV